MAEIKENRASIDLLRKDLSEHTSEIKSLQTQREELEESVNAIEKRKHEAETTAQTLESALKEAKAVLKQKESDCAVLEQDFQEARQLAQQEQETLQNKLSETLEAMDAVINKAGVSASEQAGGEGVSPERVAFRPPSKAALEGSEGEIHQQRIVASEAARGDERHLLGDILVAAGIIDKSQLREALAEQRRAEGELLGAVLARMEIATEDAIAQALGCQLELSVVRPRAETIERDAVDCFHRDSCLWHVMVPIRLSGERLVLAMANPLDEAALKKATDLSKKEVVPMVATPTDILAAVDAVYGVI